jgi:hypothetical protein
MSASEFEKRKKISELKERVVQVCQDEKIALEKEILDDNKYKEHFLPICKKIVEDSKISRIGLLWGSNKNELIKSIDEKFIPELNWYLDNIIEKHFTCLNSKIEETVREFINDIPRNRLKKAVTMKIAEVGESSSKEFAGELSKVILSDFTLSAISLSGAILSGIFFTSDAGKDSLKQKRKSGSPNPLGLVIFTSIAGLLIVGVKILTTDLAEQIADMLGPKDIAVGSQPGILYRIWHAGIVDKKRGVISKPLKKEIVSFDRIWEGAESDYSDVTGSAFSGIKNIMEEIIK